jgi:uncharacterized integral membrane protein
MMAYKHLFTGYTALLILMLMSHNNKAVFFFLMVGQFYVGLGILIFEVCGSHSVSAHSAGLLWASDRRNDLNVT